jgi:hypothetical protein
VSALPRHPQRLEQYGTVCEDDVETRRNHAKHPSLDGGGGGGGSSGSGHHHPSTTAVALSDDCSKSLHFTTQNGFYFVVQRLGGSKDAVGKNTTLA